MALKGRNRWLQTNNQELSIFQRLQDSEPIGVLVKFSMEQLIELLAYTPKHYWWLNQVEIWFSILVCKLLRRASFISQDDLKNRTLNFIDYCNQIMAKRFKWIYKGNVLAI